MICDALFLLILPKLHCRRLPPVTVPGLRLRRPGKKPYPARYQYFKTNIMNKLLLYIICAFVLYTVIISLLKVQFDNPNQIVEVR